MIGRLVSRRWRRLRRTASGWWRYARDFRAYSKLAGSEPLRLADVHARIHDRTRTTPFDAHYLYQAVWAYRAIQRAGVAQHVDVGSEITFVALLTAVTEVTFFDIRPLGAEVPRLTCKAGSLLALPLDDRSVPSLSSLHVAEHVGLGRYGDPLDPAGTRKAAAELSRVLAPGGDLYFSLPVGRPRVCFNAHRIHHPHQILSYFPDLELASFAAVTDRRELREGIDPGSVGDACYACGLFHFRRPARGDRS